MRMEDLKMINNPRGDDKVIDACSVFGMMDTSGKRFSGKGVVEAIANMHVRGNGLGGGLAIYGLYPEFPDDYCLHIMYMNKDARPAVESFIKSRLHLRRAEEIPTQLTEAISKPPLTWRYFVQVDPQQCDGQSEDDYMVAQVMEINTKIKDAFVSPAERIWVFLKALAIRKKSLNFSAWTSMRAISGLLTGVFPTNTPGWWGGAHPFSILDWTVVHNGEISSYGINRRYLEQFGYQCTMQTDTEVIAYAVDLLARRHKLPMNVIAKVLAAPLWDEIARCPPEEQKLLYTLRQVYGSLLLNGPFTVIIAHQGEMVGLTDRIRLRPLVVGTKGSVLYLSSEESAIRLICPDLEDSWSPMGGEPVIGSLQHPLNVKNRSFKKNENLLKVGVIKC